ncbi:MAG: hypothetical protein KAT00_14275 [Planctomycetes bacterium]|nr:hypothetical protein [Planctomycetota bacterium]
MRLRREDEKIVRSLATVGAFFGACIGVLAIVNASRIAHRDLQDEQGHIDEYAPILQLDQSQFNAEQVVTSQLAVDNVARQLQQKNDKIIQLEQGFWITLPTWGYAGLCIGAGLGSMALSYLAFWVIVYLGSLTIYKVIRSTYTCIRRLAPNSTCAQLETLPDGSDPAVRRNDSRVLPAVIKLSIMLIIALVLLAVAVYQLTAMQGL